VSPNTSAPPSVTGIDKSVPAVPAGTLNKNNPFEEVKPSSNSKADSSKEKKKSSFKAKLKDKLHIGSKDKDK